MSYNSYDLLFCCCPAISNILSEKYDVPKRNLAVVHNWSLLNPDGSENFLTDFSESSELNIIAMGNFGLLHLVRPASRALNLFSGLCGISLNVYARGSHFNRLRDGLLTERSNVILSEFIALDDLRLVYQASRTVTFVSLASEASSYAFPSRIPSALSMGSPIIFMSDSHSENGVSQFIQDNKCGICIGTSESELVLSQVVQELMGNYALYSSNALCAYRSCMAMSNNLALIKDFISSLE
jgi:hypothetical protein